MTAKRLGRPPKPPSEKASARITVHCTQEQCRLWSQRAEAYGMSLSTWLGSRASLHADGNERQRGYRDGVKDSAARVMELLK